MRDLRLGYENGELMVSYARLFFYCADGNFVQVAHLSRSFHCAPSKSVVPLCSIDLRSSSGSRLSLIWLHTLATILYCLIKADHSNNSLVNKHGASVVRQSSLFESWIVLNQSWKVDAGNGGPRRGTLRDIPCDEKKGRGLSKGPSDRFPNEEPEGAENAHEGACDRSPRREMSHDMRSLVSILLPFFRICQRSLAVFSIGTFWDATITAAVLSCVTYWLSSSGGCRRFVFAPCFATILNAFPVSFFRL